jgi:hypothetical protein
MYLLYQPAVDGTTIGRGNWSTREKTCPGAILCTSKPTLPDTGSKLGRHGGKPATIRPSCEHCPCFSVLRYEYSHLCFVHKNMASKFSAPIQTSTLISINRKHNYGLIYIIVLSHCRRGNEKKKDSQWTSSNHYWNWHGLNFIVNSIYICHCRVQSLIEINIFKWHISRHDLSLYPSH